MLLYPFSPHQFLNYIFLGLWKHEAVQVCLFRTEKLAATSQTVIIDSMCLEDEIVLQPFTDFKASGYLEHFSPCSYWMLLYCNEGYSVLAESAAAHFSTVRRKKWQQMFTLELSADFPSAGTPSQKGRDGIFTLSKMQIRLRFTPLSCQTHSVTPSSPTKLVK